MPQGEVPWNFTRGVPNRFKYRSPLTLINSDRGAAPAVFSGNLIRNDDLQRYLVLRLISLLEVNAHPRHYRPPI
ncbi:hypothetical protein D3C71_1986830 [compost metagenome]